MLIWDDEDEKSSDFESESESESKDQREGFEEEAASSMETGIDGLEEMEDGSEGSVPHLESVGVGDRQLAPLSKPSFLKTVAVTPVSAESKPAIVHRSSPQLAPASVPAAMVEPTIRKATITLRFYDERATYLCTPGDVSGEFLSQTTFDLSLEDHSYPEAVSTCLVRTIDRHASQANSGLRGSFTVQGLGRKDYRCERGESALSCRPD